MRTCILGNLFSYEVSKISSLVFHRQYKLSSIITLHWNVLLFQVSIYSKVLQFEVHTKKFPKITLCMNSIHSRKKLALYNISEETIRSYYGYNIGRSTNLTPILLLKQSWKCFNEAAMWTIQIWLFQNPFFGTHDPITTFLIVRITVTRAETCIKMANLIQYTGNLLFLWLVTVLSSIQILSGQGRKALHTVYSVYSTWYNYS